jgi:hypothetical protein
MGCCESKEASDKLSALPVERAGKNKSSNAVHADADGYVYGDADGETIFFDAIQSFSDIVGSISYPPARMMPATRASLHHPTTMLSTRALLVDNTNDGVDEDKDENKNDGQSSTAATDQSTEPNQLLAKDRPGVRDSVVTITQNLHAVPSGFAARGYPGDLTKTELEACLKLREELKKRDPAYREMVHAYSPAESEAFALCRFLRAREFHVDDVFAMLDGNDAVAIWKEAREKNFYENIGDFFNGCPVPVFMELLPIVISGLAKNGATMFYFKTGMVDVEAIECVCHLPDIIPVFWYMLHKQGTESMLREADRHDPDTTTVLSERIIVLDMKNIPTALFDTEFMKKGASITACFPETMNRTYLLNVPSAFTFVWAIVKLFMEPRTIKKIGFFARESKAKVDLLGFVDEKELLSDYGGSGASFDEVLKIRQKESGVCDRYVVKKLAVTRNRSSFTIDLEDGEKVASVLVFSKGNKGAMVFIEKTDGTILLEPSTVKRAEGAEKAHYSVELDSSKLPSGPVSLNVVATGADKENYLVAISVTSS